ncbi:MAG: chromosome partitioning protein [Candidatus Petromonas sp.]|jgi:chromosome partitioning protein|nr:chromosome partitioning protein [Candidatus Petromonas sp.]
MKSAKIISICNQKGGVGKTTTALNLGYALSKAGKKVLLVDLDPQSNLTMCFGIDQPEELDMTIYHLMMSVIEEKELPDKSAYILSKDGLDLIPCSIELSAVEVNLVNAMSREMTLKSILYNLKGEYDYIIIDCMPSLGMLTINALVACNSALITATPQYLSAKGLELLLRTIMKVKRRINPGIEIDGILITMYTKRTLLSKEILNLINDAYGKQIRIFKSKIPVSVKVGESNFNSKSIIEYQPKNNVAIAYNGFVKEYVANER